MTAPRITTVNIRAKDVAVGDVIYFTHANTWNTVTEIGPLNHGQVQLYHTDWVDREAGVAAYQAKMTLGQFDLVMLQVEES